MLPGPPTTPTTTSNPQAPCQALPQPLQPHLRKGSPPSLHLLANQTIPRLGKSITKKLVSSVLGSSGVSYTGSSFTDTLPCSSGQQPQQPGAPPQQDYTKAWEEYYKKQGKLLGGDRWGSWLGRSF